MQAPPLGLALIRIGVGALLLDEARHAYSAGVGPHLITDCAHRIALAPELLARLGQEVLLRMPEASAWSWVIATALVGSAYFVGAFTRPASLALLVIATLRWSFGPVHEQSYALLLAICGLGCGLADAGRRLGLDPTLGAALPSWLTWTSGKPGKRASSS